MIPYGMQDVRDADISAVVAALKSDWLTQGPAVPRFESAVADYCGAAYAVATNSATSALHVAALALGVAPGKRLWTTPNTFVASANCGLYCGAEVDFVDIDYATGNISVAALESKLEAAESRGDLPDVVVPVHFAGLPCEMVAVRSLADRYGFKIIEDASHAIGARCGDRRIGCGSLADITIFSFHPVKIITTGEGGMALTDSPEIAAKMRRLRSHGITRDPAEMTAVAPGAWYYEQIELGYNYRMTDLQASLGVSQLARLDEYVARRAALAARYDRLLAGLALDRPCAPPSTSSAWHLYVVHMDEGVRRAVFDFMRTRDIGVNVHYIPVHLQPWYRNRGFSPGDFPAAERHYARALSLPLFPNLTEADQDRVVKTLRAALEANA